MTSLYIAVAAANNGGGNCVLSADGVTWTPAENMPKNGAMADVSWHAICYSVDLNLFCAVTTSAAMSATSSDGVTWNVGTLPNGNNYNSICWSHANGIFCAVSQSGDIITSPDGLTWTSQTSPNSNPWYCVFWCEELGLFIADAPTGAGQSYIITSPDGVTWTERTKPGGTGLGSMIAYDSTNAILCDASNQNTATSTDGITWTAGGNQNDYMFNMVARPGGGFLATGNDSTVDWCSSPSSWSTGSYLPGNSAGPQALIYDSGNDLYVVVGNNFVATASSSAATTGSWTSYTQSNINLGAVAANTGHVSSPTGTMVVTETPDTATFVGTGGPPGVSGELVTTEALDYMSAVGAPAVQGTFVVTEPKDTFAGYGYQPIGGHLTATETPDRMTAAGVGYGQIGTFNTTEALDIMAADGTVIEPVIGTFETSENLDTFRALGAGATRAQQNIQFFVT